MRTSLLYAAIATLATAVNLACQFAFIQLYAGGFAVPLSVGFGTLAALPVKYVLDKRYIFDYRTDSLVQNAETFLGYSVLAVATTLVFWIVEFAFDAFFRIEAMRYAGGAIGLALGYTLKYQLDRRFVFCRRNWST